ncbi:hypothetical protein ACHAXA_006692 [Cyclostephanos tholiformis]|uniref:Uncharacterized protein n=1 Tax=Cyclostephanos tholiformis TaxID=382380 RepID=A0ABD3RTV5_9STRA
MHRMVRPSSSVIECDRSETNTSDLEIGALFALKRIGSPPESTVALQCADDQLMKIVCGIYIKTPIGTKAASGDFVNTTSEEEYEFDENIKSVKVPVPTEEVLALLDHATTKIVSPTSRIVSPTMAFDSPERKAKDDANDSLRSSHTTFHMDGGWFDRCVDDATFSSRLVAKKARRDDADTELASSLWSPIKVTTLPSSVPSMDATPFKNDPVDGKFRETLHDPHLDAERINPAHIIIREHVLEVRRTASGKVFLQCTFCKHLPQNERSKQSTISPQSIGHMYRANVRFMMNHVKHCEFIPEYIKDYSPKQSKLANFCGVKQYWMESARNKGLRDDKDRKCIVYCPKN